MPEDAKTFVSDWITSLKANTIKFQICQEGLYISVFIIKHEYKNISVNFNENLIDYNSFFWVNSTKLFV